MIKIGVNENVYLGAAEKQTSEDKKVSLVVGFAEIGVEVVKASNNPLDLLNEASDESGDSTLTKIMVFPPSLVYLGDSFDGKHSKDDQREGKDIFDDFVDIKNQLFHILRRFMPETAVKFDLLKGIQLTPGANPHDIVAAFSKEAIATKVFDNLISQFIAMVTPYIGDQTKVSRLMLVRTSATKHFGTIRKKYLGSNPFFEDGKLSIAESALYTKQTKGTTKLFEPTIVNDVAYVPNFNAYELKNGLDSDKPIMADDEDGAVEDPTADPNLGLSSTLFETGDAGDAASDTSSDVNLEGTKHLIMFDELDYLMSIVSLNDDSILQRVDEYTLYCYYLGFSPNLRRPYKSPLRDGDSLPSFSIYITTKLDREYFWKDSGGSQSKGVSGDSGDIFKLIRLLYGDTLKQCYSRINRDFELGFESDTPPPTNFEKIVRHDPPIDDEPAHIRIKKRPFRNTDLQFWGQFGITAPTLKLFKVIPISYYWSKQSQQYPITADKLAYAYPINGKYKIYQPKSRAAKFRTDYDYKCLEGFDQLEYKSDTLIITKSTKDIMVLKEYGYEAVSPRGESVPIPEEFIRHFNKKYKRILIFFDNDGKHKAEDYPFPEIYVPIESHEKDISDFRRRYGHKQTEYLLKKLIGH